MIFPPFFTLMRAQFSFSCPFLRKLKREGKRVNEKDCISFALKKEVGAFAFF